MSVMKRLVNIFYFNKNHSYKTKFHNRQLISFVAAKGHYYKNQAFIVPNMSEFIRTVTEYGQIGAIKKLLWQLSPFQLIILLWWNKFNLFKLIKKDFSTGILLLIQIELLQIISYKPKLIVLIDQVNDLAVALNNANILKYFISFVNNKLHIDTAIITNNLPTCLEKFADWKINPRLIFSPFNNYGYEMNPKKQIVESYLFCINQQRFVAIIPKLNKKELNYLDKFKITNILLDWF